MYHAGHDLTVQNSPGWRHYANVVATGAIFIALGGGAYAVTAVPSANSVVFACAKKKGGRCEPSTKGHALQAR